MKVERIVLSDVAKKDLARMPRNQQISIRKRIDELIPDLHGDVKRLTDVKLGFRLRVGRYRVLFGVDRGPVTIYGVKHRREAYR